MDLRSHFSQFLLFSESPMMSPNFLNHCVIHQDLVEHVDDQKKIVSRNTHILSCISRHSNFAFRLSWTRGNKERRYCRNCSVSQDHTRFFSLQQCFNRSCKLRTWSLNRLTVRDSWSCCVGNSSNLRCFFSLFLLKTGSFQFFNFSATSCKAFLMKMVLHLQVAAHMYSLTLSLICPLISFRYLSSLRFKLTQWLEWMRILNFFAPKFWISMLYSVACNFLWTEVSPMKACWALRSRCSRRSRSSEQDSVSLKSMTPSAVPSTFLWHRLCNTDHRTFSLRCFSLSCNGLPRHPFSAFSLKSKITMRNVRNRGSKHCGNTEQSSVLACGFREVRDAFVVRIVDGRRVVCRSGLVELLGLITCVETGLGQVAKLLGARAEVRLALLGRMKLGKDCADGKVVTKWPCGNSKDGGRNMRVEKARRR